LNHGAFGATLKGALASKQLWAEHVECQPVRFLDRELFPHLVHITRGLAEVLECKPQDILPMASSTQALSTLLRSWQRRFLPGPGQRALIFSVAYGSTKKLLRKLSDECGLQVDEVAVEFPLAGEEVLLDSLGAALNPETKLVVLDAMPSNAPFLLPLDEAVALCRRKAPEALVVVDAAHALGGFPLSLRTAKVDALFTNCHKWFCGPKGTAVLYVAPEHQSWVEPLVISHGFGADFVSGFYWSGLTDWSSWLALDAVLKFWGALGLEPSRTYCNYLVQDAAEMLSEEWGTGLGIPAEMLGPMALIELPLLPALTDASQAYTYEQAEVVQNALFRRKIEVPVKALSGRLYVRISAHIYNSIEEYEELRDVVLELANGAEL